MTLASRTHDPATSHEAERRFTESGARATHCALVLAAVRAQPGSTGTELGAAVWPGDAKEGRYRALRRLNDLRRAGIVRQGSPRRSGGRAMVTWWLTQEPTQGRLWKEVG